MHSIAAETSPPDESGWHVLSYLNCRQAIEGFIGYVVLHDSRALASWLRRPLLNVSCCHGPQGRMSQSCATFNSMNVLSSQRGLISVGVSFSGPRERMLERHVCATKDWNSSSQKLAGNCLMRSWRLVSGHCCTAHEELQHCNSRRCECVGEGVTPASPSLLVRGVLVVKFPTGAHYRDDHPRPRQRGRLSGGIHEISHPWPPRIARHETPSRFDRVPQQAKFQRVIQMHFGL